MRGATGHSQPQLQRERGASQAGPGQGWRLPLFAMRRGASASHVHTSSACLLAAPGAAKAWPARVLVNGACMRCVACVSGDGAGHSFSLPSAEEIPVLHGVVLQEDHGCDAAELAAGHAHHLCRRLCGGGPAAAVPGGRGGILARPGRRGLPTFWFPCHNQKGHNKSARSRPASMSQFRPARPEQPRTYRPAPPNGGAPLQALQLRPSLAHLDKEKEVAKKKGKAYEEEEQQQKPPELMQLTVQVRALGCGGAAQHVAAPFECFLCHSLHAASLAATCSGPKPGECSRVCAAHGSSCGAVPAGSRRAPSSAPMAHPAAIRLSRDAACR